MSQPSERSRGSRPAFLTPLARFCFKERDAEIIEVWSEGGSMNHPIIDLILDQAIFIGFIFTLLVVPQVIAASF